MTESEPLRIHRLQKMALSPAHFAADEPEQEAEEEETPSMEKGKFFHAHVLKGAELAVCPCRRDPRMKQYQEFLAESAGKLVVTKTQEKHLRGMKAAVLAHPEAPALLEGIAEETMLWTWMGKRCRGTPDVRSSRFITELKTTRCAEPRWFHREAHRRSYHTQLVWYEQGANIVEQRGGYADFRELWIVAVESAPPYAVTCLEMEDDRREHATKQIRLWMERLKACEASGSWPAYTDAAVGWGMEDPWGSKGGAADIDDEVLA